MSLNLLHLELDWIWNWISHLSSRIGRNVLIFGVDLSSSVHTANKVGSTLVLGESLLQISGPTLYPEKIYSVNFTEINFV